MEERIPLICSDFSPVLQSATFERAVQYAGFGKFQIILLFICGFVYATCAISTTTLSFILPSAECDFELSSTQKGELTAVPLVGMILGSFLWGYLADSRGRRYTLILSLLVDFFAGASSAFAKTYVTLLTCRFFNGFGIIGATSLIFSFMGEFLSVKKRDSLLSRLEVFWDVGSVSLAGVAWLILTQSEIIPSPIGDDYFPLSAWKLFLLACSFPSLVSVVLLCCLPETPKFLMTSMKYRSAKDVFKYMYHVNTGRSIHDYPELTFVEEMNCYNQFAEDCNVSVMSKVLVKFRRASQKVKVMASGSYLKYIVLVCFINFGLMSSYYTLIMWFPDLFERIKIFENLFTNTSSTICTISESVAHYEGQDVYCPTKIDNDVFLYTLIIGISCLPTSILLPFFIKKFGKKLLLVFILIIPGFATVGFNWAVTTNQTLTLACVFQTFTSVAEAVLFCIVVDLFPTNLRGFALSLTATSGRIGAIMGNFGFGLYIDTLCVLPINTFGALLIASGLLCSLIPHSERQVMDEEE